MNFSVIFAFITCYLCLVSEIPNDGGLVLDSNQWIIARALP